VITMEKRDLYGRLLENDERKFRPVDGEDISEDTRKAHTEALANGNLKKALAIQWEILTSETPGETDENLNLGLNVNILGE